MSLFTPYCSNTRIFIAVFISNKCSALKIHDKYNLHDENLPRIMKCERNSSTYLSFDVNASTTYKSETNLTWQEISRSLLIEFASQNYAEILRRRKFMVFDQINDEIYYLANNQSLARKLKIGRGRVCRLELRSNSKEKKVYGI